MATNLKHESWNPVTGCTIASEGCFNCYAEVMAKRFKTMGNERYRNGFKLTLQEESLLTPTKWKKPRIIFANSMYDIFHEDLPFHYIDKIFETVTIHAPQHIYMFLTKRASRMKDYFIYSGLMKKDPLPNVWFGVTAENQKRADERIPFLLEIPAKIRWVCASPLIGPLDIGHYLDTGLIHYVSCAGESGKRFRAVDPDWVRSLRDQVVPRNIPFSFMSWGGYSRDRSDNTLDGVKWEQGPHFQ